MSSPPGTPKMPDICAAGVPPPSVSVVLVTVKLGTSGRPAKGSLALIRCSYWVGALDRPADRDAHHDPDERGDPAARWTCRHRRPDSLAANGVASGQAIGKVPSYACPCRLILACGAEAYSFTFG